MGVYEQEGKLYAILISQNSWYAFIRILNLSDKKGEGVELIENVELFIEDFYDVEF